MKEDFWYCYWRVWDKTYIYQGRASREEFWTFVLGSALLLVAAIVVTISLVMACFSGPELLYWSWVGFISVCGIAFFLLLMPVLAVGIRRMHDIGISGWWFGSFILINIIVIPAIFLACVYLGYPYKVEYMILDTCEIVRKISAVIVIWLCVQPSKL